MTLTDKSNRSIKAIKTIVKSSITSSSTTATTRTSTTKTSSSTRIKALFTHEPEEIERKTELNIIQTSETITTEDVDTDVNNIEQHCVLIPSYGFRRINEQGKEEWCIKVRGWGYAKNQSRKRRILLGVARRIVGVANDLEKSRILEDRFGMFLTKNLKNQRYNIKKEKKETKDGYESEKSETDIPVEVVDRWAMESHETNVRLLKLLVEPQGVDHSDKAYYGFANLIDKEGISVISDIDDTIKCTGITSGPRTVLSNTFLNELKEVDGMADVYKEWYDKGAAIHYVSNSPWQLFPMLRKFFHNKKFPPGSAHLKFYDDLMKTLLLEGRGESKRNYIEEILNDFPKRKFILVGDSEISTPRSFGDVKKNGSNSSSNGSEASYIEDTGGYFSGNLEMYSSSSPVITPITPMTPIIPDKSSSSSSSSVAAATSLQQFMEKVKQYGQIAPFTLFQDSKELRENEDVNRTFREYSNEK
ncbi:709_t:CDS:2 [Entrophospora sp. SA101]|nr:9654_t:CDS:2 [Entrophospora sp. SA101]CAJ0831594.1 709_t:CDS:2 [Entrophospora sp. SA101]